MKSLWVEDYRPKTLSEYVFSNDEHRKTIEQWVSEGSIPHVLLYGSAGTGKTSLARVLIHDLGVQDADTLFINASRDNGVDFIRDRVTQFASTVPWGDFKIVLLDEADYLSPNAQAALRGIMSEQYHSVVRFILTCNYVNRIIPAIKSRTQELHVSNQDMDDFTTRAAEILIKEGIDFELDVLDAYVRATYPDLRKTLNSLQQSSSDGVLRSPKDSAAMGSDWKLKMVELFKKGKLKEGRKLICENATIEDYDDIYRFLYRNLDFFGETEDDQDEAVIVIRDSMVKHVSVSDPEINLAACLVELGRIRKE